MALKHQLHSVIYLATTENVARQVAESSRNGGAGGAGGEGLNPSPLFTTMTFFSKKYLMENAENTISEPLDFKLFSVWTPPTPHTNSLFPRSHPQPTHFNKGSFLQRFQTTFRFVTQSNGPVAKCEPFCNVSCNFSQCVAR